MNASVKACVSIAGRTAIPRRLIFRPHIVLLLLMPLLLAACARATEETPTLQPTQGKLQGGVPTVKAPTALQGDFRTHDPSIIGQDGKYYVFSTGDEGGLNQGTIRIRRSTDLVNWKGIPKLQIHDLDWTSDGWPQVAGD